jgi:hypothetical protein
MTEEPVASTASGSTAVRDGVVDRPSSGRRTSSRVEDALARLVTAVTDLPRPVQAALATLVYAAVAIQLSWPLITDLDTRIFGAFGDLTGGIAVMREMVDGHHNPFLPGTLHDFSAPEGRPIEWTQNLASFSSTSVLYLLTLLFGAVPAFSLFMLGGFVASGTAMFLLVRRLTGNFAISLLVGWAFAFYPFPVVKAGGHIHFVHGWPLVLVLWRMIVLHETPSRRNAVFAGLATVLALSWSQYYLLVGGVAFGALLVFSLASAAIRRRDFRPQLRAQLLAGGIVALFAVALAALAVGSGRGTGTEAQTLDALNAYSARPFEYVVPPNGNALVGDRTGPWLQDHIHGSNFAESTLYVGLSMIALSLIALVAAARRRLTPATRWVVAAVAFTGVVALLFSAPPQVSAFGELIPFPSLVVHDISPSWRVYARFVMVVMMVVCVLAAIGLQRTIRGRPLMVQAAIMIVVAVIVVLDLRIRPVGTNTLDIPPIYNQLKALPEGTVAEYPIEAAGHGDYSGEFYQDYHGKPIINGFDSDTLSEFRALRLDKLSRSVTPGRLRTAGVSYVVDTHVPVEGGVTKPGKPGRGLRLIADSKYAALYAVTAAPLPLVTLGPGFSLPEEIPIGKIQWLSSDEGEIELRAPCSHCAGTLEMKVVSFAQPRTVTLRDPDGRVPAARRAGVQPRTISFPVRFDRRVLLKISTDPGPQPAGRADDRDLSVAIAEPRLRLRSRAR